MLDQPAAELVDHLQRALHGGGRLQRMDVGEAGQPRHRLVEARIVFHRARAEREDAHVDGVVLLAEPHVMAHRLRLGEGGEVDGRLAAMFAEPVGFCFRRVDVDAGDFRAADLEEQRLLDQERAVAGEGLALRCDRLGGGGAGLVVHASLRWWHGGALPPPLRGRGGEGGRRQARSSRPSPSPGPSPQGGGEVLWAWLASSQHPPERFGKRCDLLVRHGLRRGDDEEVVQPGARQQPRYRHAGHDALAGQRLDHLGRRLR